MKKLILMVGIVVLGCFVFSLFLLPSIRMEECPWAHPHEDVHQETSLWKE